MKYAIQYQEAAAKEYAKARLSADRVANASAIYERHCAMSDFRHYSRVAAQYAKLSMLYRENEI